MMTDPTLRKAFRTTPSFTRRGALAALGGGAVLALAVAAPFGGLARAETAVEGYDVVAYFTEGAPVRGDRSHQAEWDGETWLFASAANRDRFLADPAAYAPQYGGHCSWAASRNYIAYGDPEAWRIHEGKLYLNYNKSIRARWAQDIPGNVAKADANWPGLSAERR